MIVKGYARRDQMTEYITTEKGMYLKFRELRKLVQAMDCDEAMDEYEYFIRACIGNSNVVFGPDIELGCPTYEHVVFNNSAWTKFALKHGLIEGEKKEYEVFVSSNVIGESDIHIKIREKGGDYIGMIGRINKRGELVLVTNVPDVGLKTHPASGRIQITNSKGGKEYRGLRCR
jgi:hypothetical protein